MFTEALFKIHSAVLEGFFPFSPNNLLLTLTVSYYQQPSRPSLDKLKESDFVNTSYEIEHKNKSQKKNRP